mgnify:CR=1 FL=1
MGGSGGHGGHNEPQAQQNVEYPQQQQQFDQQQPQSYVQENANKCFDFSNIFNDCMKNNMNNSKVCEQSFEDLKKCQNNI